MTDKQRELARHALGLPNKKNCGVELIWGDCQSCDPDSVGLELQAFTTESFEQFLGKHAGHDFLMHDRRCFKTQESVHSTFLRMAPNRITNHGR